MTKGELLELLRSLKDGGDPEIEHLEADAALLKYIDDQKIAEAFHDIRKWYA